jgi:penicillin-binding protein 1A
MPKSPKIVMRLVAHFCGVLVALVVVCAAGVLALDWHFGRNLPDYHQLADYQPPVTSRVFAGDGRLIAEYAFEKRSFVPITAIPQTVVNAFLAAEDRNFYRHPGVDPVGVARAAVVDLKNLVLQDARRPIGGSTITQQVARNFFLSNEVSFKRKIEEAILAFRIERAFSKQHILELYLNEIYLGQGCYGVAAAALDYFDKGLDRLTVGEAAFLGGLPKAPNKYDPSRDPEVAKVRRDWVIARMAEDGYITPAQARAARAEPLTVRPASETVRVPDSGYFAEDVRREIAGRYGEDALYKGGLVVRSTLDPALQAIAASVLRKGLIAYDRRHGWRGPVSRIDPGLGWRRRLAALPVDPDISPWTRAVVLAAGSHDAEIGFADGRRGHIPLRALTWARPTLPRQALGPRPGRASDVLHPGDVIAVEPLSAKDVGKGRYPADSYGLCQVPDVEGALVAMDPHSGRVLAMQGGFFLTGDQFNRVTQAFRQPGSAFKPFVYMAALDSGYTPSSQLLDAPAEFDQGPGLPKWRPVDYEHDYLGPITLRMAVEKSRNLATVRLAAALGMAKVASYAERFGVVDSLPHELAMALGAEVTTPLRLATAYAEIVDGGKKLGATLIDRIQDRNGKTIYRHDDRRCDACQAPSYGGQDMPQVPDDRQQIVDPMTAYQMVHILEGVVERGTGKVVASVGKPLAGKTGTSNDSKDAWFVGFSPDLVAAVYVGFDQPQTLGRHETGGTAAAPIFRDFMMQALKDEPPMPFRMPPGILLARVDATTGRLARAGDRDVIYEAFKPGTLPSSGQEQALDTHAGPQAGGLY